MGRLSKQFKELELLIDFQVNKILEESQQQALFEEIKQMLANPDIDDYALKMVATRIIKLGVDYEHYVSVLLFKNVPDSYSKKQLKHLEEEIYAYIEKELYGKGLDKRISEQLEQQTILANPQLSESLARKKAMGNFGWLLPHALTQIIVDKVLGLIDEAVLQNSKGKKKGRKIRIKKMD